MADAGGGETSLEFTPSWVVALVCFSIVLISIVVDRFLLCIGKLLEKYKMWAFVGALRKIKEELMVLGFISLLLAVFQNRIGKICISERLANVWLPCKKTDSSSTVTSFTPSPFASSGTQGRRLLAEASAATDYCSQKGKVALLSVEALHHLDIFIFVLATIHVVLCALKVLLGYLKIRQWNKLEEHNVGSTHYSKLRNEIFENKLENYRSNRVQCFFAEFGNKTAVHGWVMSFFKQFYPSVTEFEYIALRLNFIEAHDLNNPKEDFQKYIIEAVQKDFEKMVGISWYLWLCAVIFLLVNVAGWHAYFWISFIPLTVLLIVGTKLEHMITQLAKQVAENHSPNETGKSRKELAVGFSKDNFWFRSPRLFRILIHIVLFENSLEIAFFFFILFQYDFHSCVMGKVGFVVPRIAIGAFVQFMCIYRTIPLYAIMKSQMDQNENQTGKEAEMWIVTMSSKMIDKIIDKVKETRLKKVAERVESSQTGSSEGSIGVKTAGSDDMNSTADIEAPNR
ncbi:MLO-like protein 15 [Rhodamnia argentea]|uniref:MLO-like protein n=1 Tax=Rhodamnia argentea TaxID=178133 RepID=A0A8B8NZV0_9MYRT|nr:MLO-like protein 15 [Rhodamnia argentea]